LREWLVFRRDLRFELGPELLKDDVASAYALMLALSSELESSPGSASSSPSFSTAQLSGAVHVGGLSTVTRDGSASSGPNEGGKLFGETFRVSVKAFRLLVGEVEENGSLNTKEEEEVGDRGG